MSAILTCAESACFGANAPQMQVVHIAHAGNLAHRGFHRLQAHATRSAFEQIFSVSRTMPTLDQRISAPIPNERAASIQYCPVHRIARPPQSRPRSRACRHLVQQRAADVDIDVLAGTPQQQRNRAVHHDARRRDQIIIRAHMLGCWMRWSAS